MCGIAGVIDLSSLVAQENCNNLLRSIEYRGPDDLVTSVHRFNDYYLSAGMVRLSIIDIEGGGQPFANDDYELFFNGEIYNYLELRSELITLGYEFKSTSDTEVLFAGLVIHGMSFLNKVDGMFALSFLNRREDRFYLARDFFGEKPLYYTKYGDTFKYCSELTALADEMSEINLDAVSEYLTFGFHINKRSYLQNVLRLDAGEMLVLDGRSLNFTVERWVKNKSLGINSINHILKASLERRLRSDVPVGLFLSGGVDSGIVAGYLNQLKRRDVTVYTLGFTHEDSENGIAASIANEFCLPLINIELGSSELLTEFIDFYERVRVPVCDPAAVGLHILSKRAAKDVKVVLSGDGGDEYFFGYNRERLRVFHILYPKIYRILLELVMVYYRWKPFKKFYDTVRLKRIQELRKDFSNIYRLYWNTCDFIAGDDFERNHSLPNYLLNKTDVVTMMSSLEARTPFLNRSLVHKSDSFDWKKHTNLMTGKKILRRIYKSLIPKKLRVRKKLGFNMPLSSVIGSAYFQDVMKNILLEEWWNKILDEQDIRDANQSCLNGDEFAAQRLWNLIIFDKFLKQIKK